MHKVRKGDVLRWDRVWSTDVSDDPVYLLVTQANEDKSGGGIVLRGAGKLHKYGPGEKYHGGPHSWSWDDDCFDSTCSICQCRHIPPEEWPDDVCRLVALYSMGIDPNM